MGMILSHNTEIRFNEFPDLLFSKSSDGVYYFDATTFISRSGIQNKSVEGFKITFAYFIEAATSVYSLVAEKIFIIQNEHILIDETLALAFLAYMDSEFAIYMCERVADMLVMGVVLSDAYILSIVSDRFRKDQLFNLLNNGK